MDYTLVSIVYLISEDLEQMGRDQVAEDWKRPRSGVDRAFYPRADTVTTHRQRWVIQRKALHTLFCSILEMTEL